MSTTVPATTGQNEADIERGLLAIRGLHFLYQNALGIIISFLNVYLQGLGFLSVQIGLFTASMPVLRIAGEPVWGQINDRFGKTRLILGIMGAGSIMAMFSLMQVRSFGIGVLAAGAALGLFFQPLSGMLNGVTMKLLGNQPENFPRIRIWGSIGFIISTYVVGRVINQLGINWMFFSFWGVMVVFIGAALLLPKQIRPTIHKPGDSAAAYSIRRLLERPKWVIYTASMFVLGLGLAGMNAFLGIYIKDLGGNEGLIGTQYALGVMVEVVIMLIGTRLLKSVGSRKLLVFAYGVFVLRWFLYSIIPGPEWAIPIGLLHGLAFGPFLIASAHYVNELAPDELKSTAQTLFFTLGLAVPNMIGSPISGQLYDTIGPAMLFRLYAIIGLVAIGLLIVGFRIRNQWKPGTEAQAE